MGQLHKTIKKKSLFAKAVGAKTFDKFHPLGAMSEKSYDQTKAAENAVAAAQAESDKVIPLPDEEMIERANRRRGMRRGGRASTVLTNADKLGGY